MSLLPVPFLGRLPGQPWRVDEMTGLSFSSSVTSRAWRHGRGVGRRGHHIHVQCVFVSERVYRGERRGVGTCAVCEAWVTQGRQGSTAAPRPAQLDDLPIPWRHKSRGHAWPWAQKNEEDGCGRGARCMVWSQDVGMVGGGNRHAVEVEGEGEKSLG